MKATTLTIFKYLLTMLLSVTSLSALAETVPEELVKNLKSKYPNTKVDAVNPTPMEGVFEVVMGRNIAYTDRGARHMVFGHMFDMERQVDLTEEKLQQVSKVDTSSLPVADAIKVVRGKGTRTLYVFADPNCGYCKKLEAEFEKLPDVTVYTFLYPILSKASEDKATSVWCSENRVSAWASAMAGGTPSSSSSNCDSPVSRNLALGSRLGVQGTPFIVASDGRVLGGYADAAKLESFVSGAKK